MHQAPFLKVHIDICMSERSLLRLQALGKRCDFPASHTILMRPVPASSMRSIAWNPHRCRLSTMLCCCAHAAHSFTFRAVPCRHVSASYDETGFVTFKIGFKEHMIWRFLVLGNTYKERCLSDARDPPQKYLQATKTICVPKNCLNQMTLRQGTFMKPDVEHSTEPPSHGV